MNRLFIFCLSLLFLASCTTVNSSVTNSSKTDKAEPIPPAWYDSEIYAQGNPNISVGFGYATGENRENDAKAKARASILSQIKTTVFASDKCKTTVLSVDKKEQVTRDCQQNIEQLISGSLSGVVEEKSEFKDNFYYIALSYDISPVHQKIAKKLKEKSFDCDFNQNYSSGKLNQKVENSNLKAQNAFAELEKAEQELEQKPTEDPNPKTKQVKTTNQKFQTPFGKDLSETMGCETDWKLDYNPNHQNWQITFNQYNISQNLFSQFNTTELEKFLPSSAQTQINFSLTKKRVKESHPYFVNFEIAENGYLSLFYVDEQAKALVMLKNKEISSNTNFQFPDNKTTHGITSEILDPEKDSINEYYLATLCKTPLNLAFFSKVTNTTTKTNQYNYGKLLHQIREVRGNCFAISSFVKVSK